MAPKPVDTLLPLFTALVAFSRSVCAILLTLDGPFLSGNKIQERERNGTRIVDAQRRRKCTSTGKIKELDSRESVARNLRALGW